MKLGEKIKLLRVEKELTQPELAEKAGIEQSYLSKLENDKGSPSFEIITRLAGALDNEAMAIINSLSQPYVEKHLSHIPEIAAEYATLKFRKESKEKKRFLIASFMAAIGLGLFLFAYYAAHMSVVAYTYISPGLITEGKEIPLNTASITTIDSNSEFLLSYEYLGDHYISKSNEGSRYYYLDNDVKLKDEFIIDKILMLSIGALGVFVLILGLCIFLYQARFKFNKKNFS